MTVAKRIEGPVLQEAVERCEYDVLGHRDGVWVRAASGITDPDEVRATLENFRFGSPSVTWTVVRRTTTIVEKFDAGLASEPGVIPGGAGA